MEGVSGQELLGYHYGQLMYNTCVFFMYGIMVSLFLITCVLMLGMAVSLFSFSHNL